MIAPISLRPKPTNKTAKYTVCACLGSALILAAVYILTPQYRSPFGIATLAFITAAAYIYNKYTRALYVYEVALDSNGDPVFTVRNTEKGSGTVLCRVDISAIASVRRLDRREHKTHRRGKETVKYSYYPTMRPEYIYLVEIRCPYENSDLYLELTDEYAKLLIAYSKEAE